MASTSHLGNYLIANPSIVGDPSFHRAIVLISAIEEDQPMGFIVNKTFDFTLNEILPEVGIPFPLFYGGPVDTDQLFFVHTAKDIFSNCLSIDTNLFLGGSLSTALKALSDGRLHQQNCRFFLGYSGWSSGQLEDELAQHHWWMEKMTAAVKLFSTAPEELWRNALEAKGGPYRLWANCPENPAHN